eukprot:1149860-Prymnesium_polylepis.1
MRMGAALSVQMVPKEAASFVQCLEADFDKVGRAAAAAPKMDAAAPPWREPLEAASTLTPTPTLRS